MDSFGRQAVPAAGAGPQPQPRMRPMAGPAAPRVEPAGGRMAPMAGRPAGPQPRPVARPAGRVGAPQGYGQQAYPQPGAAQGYQQQASPAQAAPSRQAARPEKSQGGWRVVLQFVVGLLVIAGVAAAIVALYIRYYQ